jgi:DNA-binding transcriptional LysR family regulator
VQLGIPPKTAGIHVDPLYQEPSELVARRGHPWFEGMKARGALGQLRHVRVEMVPGKNFHDPHAATFARAGVPRNVVVTVQSFSLAAEVVASSDLVTMLPKSLFVAKGRALGLRAMAVPLPARAVAIAMCWHDRTHKDPAAQAFRAIVKGVVKKRSTRPVA